MASGDERASLGNPIGADCRRRRQPPARTPASSYDRPTESRLPSPPAARRQRPPLPTESPGSRRHSPTPPLSRPSSSHHDVQPFRGVYVFSLTGGPRALTSEELLLARFEIWLRSIVVFIATVFVIYTKTDGLIDLLSILGGILCCYLYFWTRHITKFWLQSPEGDEASILMLLFGCVFLAAVLVAANVSSLAAMCMTWLPTLVMAWYLIGCIREYNRIRRSMDLKEPLNVDLHREEDTEERGIGSCAPQKHVPLHVEEKATFPRKPTATANSVKPP